MKPIRRWLVVLTLLSLAAAARVAAQGGGASFIDPTARVNLARRVRVGQSVYVAPFALLWVNPALRDGITIGDESNVQDNTTLLAARGPVRLGVQAIIAHGATVKGPASIGIHGGGPPAPSFVGFNAEVDGAIIERDAMVLHLARVGPGVRIPSGFKVMPGRNVRSNAEVPLKTEVVTDLDREFMNEVIHVNTEFAHGYAALAAANPLNVRGLNFDAEGELPQINAVQARLPAFPNRVTGEVLLQTGPEGLRTLQRARSVALRADEGRFIAIGPIAQMLDAVTFHALKDTQIQVGGGGRFGPHSIVHGGPTPFDDVTIVGDGLTLGPQAVLFRSRVGARTSIGARSLVQQCDLPAGSRVPARAVVILDQIVGQVEW